MKNTFFRHLNKQVVLPRKLLLVSMDWTRPKDPPLSLGHASILTHLKQKQMNVLGQSWSVTEKDFHVNRVIDFLRDNIKEDNVDVGLGAFVWNEDYIQKVTHHLKSEGFTGRIILGGSQVSYTKEGIEDYYPWADVFIRGYAEEALSQLMQSSLAYPVIPGVHYANHPDLGLSSTADLEQLPSPYLMGEIQPQPFLRWETQRGCPFRCGFCQHRESDVSMKRRQFSLSRIKKEIDFFTENTVVQDIAVLDPVFNSGPFYLEILHRFIERGYTGKLALQCRLEMVKPAFLDAIEALNKTASVVLEFGLQTIHREEERHIQRPNNMKKVIEVFKETHRRGIKTEVSLIFGLPGQTVRSFKESVDFCKAQHIPVIYAYPLQLHRGTPIYDNKKALGLIESTDEDIAIKKFLTEEHIGHVIESPSFTKADWMAMAEIALSLDEYNAKGQIQAPKMGHTLRHTTFWQDKDKRGSEMMFQDNPSALSKLKS